MFWKMFPQVFPRTTQGSGGRVTAYEHLVPADLIGNSNIPRGDQDRTLTQGRGCVDRNPLCVWLMGLVVRRAYQMLYCGQSFWFSTLVNSRSATDKARL